MIRKQLYIEREQERKLRKLAEHWGCTEAQVFRMALDRLADTDGTIDGRLEDAGLLVSSTQAEDVPRGEELEALESEYEAWANTLTTPIGLSGAVLEDRR